MTNIASLGVEVTSKGVPEAMKGLDSLTGAASRAEAAISGLDGASSASTGLVNASKAINVTTSSMGRAQQAVTKLTSAEQSLAGQTGNIAAQFQDIAVQLAGGQSPFLIALQQGTQLSMALGSGGGGLRSTIGALGTALLSLLSPVSLLTLGGIAAAGALYQMFTNTTSGADRSAAVLKNFDQLVEDIGKTSDVTAEKIKKMIEAPLGRTSLAADIAETQRSLQADLANSMRGLAGEFDKIDVDGMKARFLAMQDPVLRVKMRLGELGDELKTGKMTASDVFDELNKMAVAETTPKSLYGTIELLRTGLKEAMALGARLNALGGIANDNGKGGRFDAPSGTNEVFFGSEAAKKAFAERMGLFDPDVLRKELESQAKSLHPSTGGSKQSAYDSAIRSAKEQTAALQAQNAVQASLNPLVNDYGFAMTQAKTAADLLAAAERDKKQITPELTAQINAQATALANATVEQGRLAEATANAKANMELAKSSATGFLSTLRQGLVAGEGLWKSFGNAALSVLDKIASAIETKLVDALFSTGGGGFNIMSLLGLGASAFPAAPSAGLGGVLGGNSLPAAGALAGARLPAAKPAGMVQGGGVRVEVGLKKGSGLNIEPDVRVIADESAGRAAGAVKDNFDGWRKTGFHSDVEKHMSNRRKVG